RARNPKAWCCRCGRGRTHQTGRRATEVEPSPWSGPKFCAVFSTPSMALWRPASPPRLRLWPLANLPILIGFPTRQSRSIIGLKDGEMADLIPPHGGLSEVVCCTVGAGEVDAFKATAAALAKVPVSDADLSTVYRFGDGALSPLAGPMDSATYSRVLDESVIE